MRVAEFRSRSFCKARKRLSSAADQIVMTPEQWQQIKTIVQRALELEPEQRDRFIRDNCSGDEFLRGEAAELLAAHDNASGFIETPAYVGRIAKSNDGGQKLSAGTIIGRYRIESLIGEGGMGEVYLAEDTRLRRKVAIKVLPSELAADQERLYRFEQEARAASALNHPNIITIYEIGESHGLNFIATEYIEGETLHERLQRGALPLEAVLDISTQVTSALQAAHKAGIVHRDIKPDNVMIRPDGLVKILDFGIAKLIGRHPFDAGPDAATAKKLKTNPGIVIGTANYMSPEQARGKDVDARTDIWSLGVVLYEMVGGRAPFKGETITDTIVAIIEKDPPPLKSITTRRIPDKLEAVIRRALEKEPSRRFQTTGEMLVDLEAVRKRIENGGQLASSIYYDEPVNAAPTQVLERQDTNHDGDRPRQRSFRLRRLPVIASAAAIIVLAALAVALFLIYRQWPAANSAQVRSLAVLPLKSLSSEVDYLGLGVADAIIRRISQTGKIIVRPTNSVRRYLTEDADSLEAAHQLAVDAVLNGTVQRAGDRLRVTVELTRASDGALLWADSFDMRAADIFTIQDNVAQQIATRLSLQIDPAQRERLVKRGTSNPVAYDYYVKGLSGLDLRRFGETARPQLEQTIDLFQKAVDTDPNFALARAQLAFCYAWMGIFIDPTEVWIDRSREQLALAEAVDSGLVEVHMTRYLIYFSAYENFQIDAAIREIRAAQQIDPGIGHDELGNLYQHLGLEDLAELEMRRALEIDPTSEYVKNTILGNYRIVKLFDKWAEANQLLLNGRTRPSSWMYISQKRADEAEAILKEEIEKSLGDATMLTRKALLLAVRGNFAEAERQIQALLPNMPAKNLAYHHLTYDIACVYSLQGKSGEAVKWLRETAATGFPAYPLFQRDHFLDAIRQSPEFVRFMAEMKEQAETYRREFE